jgi:diadenosine tetraphosphate (Ap4A) HIT family hydrolase
VIVMPGPLDCYTCSREQRFDRLPVRERIAHDRHWRLAHAIHSALPGWLVLLPRRHVITIADLTDAEAARLGTWQVAASRALHAVTGATKTYVAQFAEAEGFSHVHFHLVPRLPDQPADRRGPAVFGYLSPDGDHVSDDAMDALSTALHQALTTV